MGSKGGSDEQTISQEPWSGVQEPLKNLYNTTQSALANTQPYYPGQTYPNLTPLQEAGMFGNLDYAQNYYAPATTGYQNQLAQYMDAPLNISQDPAVQAQMLANRTQAQDWLMNQALPGVRQGAQANNMYGSSRQGLAEGQAIGDATKALTNANAQTMANAYNTASGLAGRAAGMFPGALQMGFAPGDLANQYGGIYQGLAGQQVSEDMQRYFFPEQNLWNNIGIAGNVYSGAGTYGTQTGPGDTSSPLAGALGGAMMGASAVPMLGGTFGTAATATAPAVAASPWAWPVVAGGAILGGLL